jgi:hypothetical protein
LRLRLDQNPSPKILMTNGTTDAVKTAFNAMPNPAKLPVASLSPNARAVAMPWLAEA